MRSHFSLPIFSRDSCHRARPHCAVSLATASASRSVQSHDDLEPMDVDVDPPVAVVMSSEELPPCKDVHGVPFPSGSEKFPRKHALLRSSSPLVTSILTNRKHHDHDSSEPLSPTTENQPPRKRTRTSALLQPPIKSHRSPRVQSLPMRHPPSRLPRPSSSLMFLGNTKPPNTPKPAEELFIYAFPPSMPVTIMPHPLLDLISWLVAPASLDNPSIMSSLPLPRRRQPFSGGTVLLRNVYKSVVRGLALKYSMTDFSQSSFGNTLRSSFDIQDALLADRLRCHLTLQGEDINMIIFEIEKTDSQQTEPPADASSPDPVMSYERLLPVILLQKRSEGRKTIRKALGRLTNRKSSGLAESYTID